VSWWSYRRPFWTVLAGWIQPKVVRVEPLTLDHPAIVDAAQALQRPVRLDLCAARGSRVTGPAGTTGTTGPTGPAGVGVVGALSQVFGIATVATGSAGPTRVGTAGDLVGGQHAARNGARRTKTSYNSRRTHE
jgi:hypothetical protein